MATKKVTCAKGLKVEADVMIGEVKDKIFDVIFCPGGSPGSQTLADCTLLIDMLRAQKSGNRWMAAICAAPAIVFKANGLIGGPEEKATCYEMAELRGMIKENFVNERVVVSKNLLTSVGPASAIEFGLKIVELLVSKDKSDAVAKELMASRGA